MRNNFERFKLQDFIAVIAIALLGFALNYFVTGTKTQAPYVIYLFILVLLTSFLGYLVRKVGIVTIFLLVLSLVTYNIDGIGLKGMGKVYSYVIIGLIFDFVLMISKGEGKNTVTNVLVSSIIAFTLYPLITALLLSRESVMALISATLNLTLLSILISIAGSLVSYLVWKQFRATKTFLRFEFGS